MRRLAEDAEEAVIGLKDAPCQVLINIDVQTRPDGGRKTRIPECRRLQSQMRGAEKPRSTDQSMHERGAASASNERELRPAAQSVNLVVGYGRLAEQETILRKIVATHIDIESRPPIPICIERCVPAP